MDELIPKIIVDAAQNILGISGAIIVTAIVNPYFLIPILIMSFIFIFLSQVYLKTSNSLKILEANSEYS